MGNNKNISFHLVGIETLQFAIIKDCYKEDCDIKLQVGVPIKANDEGHLLAVVLDVKFTCEEKPFIVFEVMCEFDIESEAYNSFFTNKREKSTLRIPVGLGRHLATITVGTARGILHEKLKKTEFYDYILPTIDLTHIMIEDIVLNKTD